MGEFQGLARWLILFGSLLVLFGVLLLLVTRIPGLGRLPGDIVWRRENFTFYFPLTTSLLLSLLLTLLLNLLWRRR